MGGEGEVGGAGHGTVWHRRPEPGREVRGFERSSEVGHGIFVLEMVFGLGICGLVGDWTWPGWSDSLILRAVASVATCMRGNRTKSSRRLDRDEAAGGRGPEEE
jgi:hypothetical protein